MPRHGKGSIVSLVAVNGSASMIEDKNESRGRAEDRVPRMCGRAGSSKNVGFHVERQPGR